MPKIEKFPLYFAKKCRFRRFQLEGYEQKDPLFDQTCAMDQRSDLYRALKFAEEYFLQKHVAQLTPQNLLHLIRELHRLACYHQMVVRGDFVISGEYAHRTAVMTRKI